MNPVRFFFSLDTGSMQPVPGKEKLQEGLCTGKKKDNMYCVMLCKIKKGIK